MVELLLVHPNSFVTVNLKLCSSALPFLCGQGREALPCWLFHPSYFNFPRQLLSVCLFIYYGKHWAIVQ